MSRYLSGRSKKRPQSQLRDDRNRYLSVDQAEPNLGDPTELDLESNLPPGQQYQIISVIGSLGERYWIPRGGGLIPGAITVFDEGVIVPNNSGVSSISQLIFKGNAIRAEGYLNSDGSPGIGATITVFSPGTQGQFIVNNNNDFYAAPSIFYSVGSNYIGIGTSSPTQILDINGNVKLRGTIYDWDNNPGTQGYIIIKNSDGGLSWVDPKSITTGAGGTIGQIQFHSNTGLVDGADVFYYDFVNNRVGIGSTQPKYLLDVSGISSFRGTTYIDNLNVTNLGTFNNLTANNTTTFKGSVDAEIGASLNNITIGIGNSNEINTSSGNLILNSQSGQVVVDDKLAVTGVTSVGFITSKNSYVSGILTATNLDFFNTVISYLTVGVATITFASIENLDVTGVATNKNLNVTNYLGVSGTANFTNSVKVNDLIVTGISTFGDLKVSKNTLSSSGDLIIDSVGKLQSKDEILVDVSTESTSTSTGSLTTKGGIGISKNANVGGNFKVNGTATLSADGGITTTGGDLYVGGDLYINDDLFFDAVNANTGIFAISLTTKDFNATGKSTISTLNVTGLSTFTGLIDANGGATINDIRVGIATSNAIDTSTGNLILNSSGGTVSVDDNLTVSGTATFNGNVDLGNATTDTVTFTATVNSNIIPSTNNTRDLGSSSLKWNQVYATEFVGQFIGNADTSTKLATPRNFSITGDVDAPAVSFDGSDDVILNTTLDNTGVTAGTYGNTDGTSYSRFTVDSKGRITSASNVGIDFTTATVSQSNSIRTVSTSTNVNHFLTFVDSNNTTASYESLYTDGNIFYNPSSDLLTLSNITVSGIATFNGNVNLGNATTDTVTFTATVDSDIIPSTNNTRDLGSSSLKWNQVYATEFVGQFIGNADTATIATNLAGGTVGDIPYQTAANTTTFLADPGISGNGYVLTWNNGTTSPQWSDLTSLSGAGYTLDVIQTGGDDLDPVIRLSDGSTNDDVTIVGGSNITVTRNSDSQLTIAAVAGAGLAPNNTIADIINVTGGIISADDPGADRIFFWDDSQGKATHLSVGAGISINGTTLSATSDAGKTYTLDAVDSSNDVILRLSDGSTNDDVKITAGSNITINPVASGGFTISAASLSDLGGISGIQIKDSGVSKGTGIIVLDFTGDISATASGNTASINVTTPKDISDLTDTTNQIPTDISDLTDTTNQIPTDISDLTDTTSLIKTYSIEVPTGTTSLRLTDGTTTDDITLSAGSNISLARVSDSEIKFSVASNDSVNYTTTAVNKTLTTYEHCTVTTDELTLTLPASPSVGDEVTVVVGGNFYRTTINRNGSNIMGIAEDMTIDYSYATATFTYINTTRGWWVS